MGVRESKRTAMRERILAVCDRLFRDPGFDEASIDDIIERCAISRQTFFNYFPGKDAVLAELGMMWLRSQAESPRAGLQRAGKASVLAGMRTAIAAQARAIEGDADFVKLVVLRSAFFAGDDRHAAARRDGVEALFDAIAAILRAGQEKGEIARTVDPRSATETLVSAMFMTVRLWASGYRTDGASLETRLMAALDLIETGLEPR